MLLFSATFDDALKAFASWVVGEANQLYVKEELTLEKVKQYKIECPDELAKIEVIADKILLGKEVGQTIIFVKTRHSAAMLRHPGRH